MKVILIVLLLGTCLYSSCYGERLAAPSKENRKQLAGPPEEFASMDVPSTAAASLRVDSTLLPFTLTKTNGEYIWTTQYPVDTPDAITVTVLSPYKSYLTFYLKSPTGSDYVKIDKDVFEGPLSTGKSYYSPSFGIDGNVVPAYSYTFFNPPIGFWDIKIIASNIPAPAVNSPHGFLLLDNISPYKLVSQLTSYNLEVGQEVGVAIYMSHEPSYQVGTASDDDPLPIGIMQEVILTADMNVKLPDGSEVVVKMRDDGLGKDLVAGDSIYTGTILSSEEGNYVFTPTVSGDLSDHVQFLRSASHLVAVSAPQMKLTGQAHSVYDATTKIINFEIQVNLDSSLKEDTVRAYAEVWGTSSSDKTKLIPIAWVQAMVDTETSANGVVVGLQLNDQWIVKSGAASPFVLRNVILQDRETNAILSEKDEIRVASSSAKDLASADLLQSLASQGPREVIITEEMKYGPRPARYARPSPVDLVSADETVAANPKLILVHGYCSGDVWNTAHFTNAIKFQDYSKSRSHDQFALLIVKFAEENGVTSFGLVGHSQGGMAGLHLKSYYWSGLDLATGGRVLQSVGTPYKGCSLAGALADLGGFFGVGCSSNADLATNGAQLWLSKVPKDAQDQVYYYNTQYDDSWFLSPACITASSLVLFSPNDGTCENKFSQPDKGGNFLGMKKKWCHISGMNYPAQTTDQERNAEMNKNAAR